MFTGIIESQGIIRDTRCVAGGRLLSIDVGAMARQCAVGMSLSISGVCLTVSHAADRDLAFDVVKETLDRTNLGSKGVGDRVNLERSLRLDGRLDGHFVQGHVDGTARVERTVRSARETVMWFLPEPSLWPYLVPKGSVALDGVSLTIAEVADETFSVALIPTTLQRTTLSSLTRGDRVNLETDIITRAIVHLLSRQTSAPNLSLSALREAGFA